jgi:hypothetical protein
MSHSHPGSGALPFVMALGNVNLACLAWWLLCNVYRQSGPLRFEGFDEADCMTRGERIMVAANRDDRAFSGGFKHVPAINRLAERARHDFDLHVVLARERLSLESVRREIYFREPTETEDQAGPVARKVEGTNGWSLAPPLPSAKDIRLHAWLSERLAVLHHERHGLWPRLRRFLFGNRLVRWLRRSLPILAWTAISFALQGPGLWAKTPQQDDLVELGSLKSRVPADWVEEKPNHAQYYKQYRLEPVSDDKDYAYATFWFVGKEKGGTAEGYLKRWKGMFLPPEGKTMQEASKVRQLTVNGAPVTYLDVHGDYKGVPGDDSTPRQNYRLLGVYLDTPQGPYIIRVLGPAQTVTFYSDEFDALVKAFK